jgi:hypothetical protein
MLASKQLVRDEYDVHENASDNHASIRRGRGEEAAFGEEEKLNNEI